MSEGILQTFKTILTLYNINWVLPFAGVFIIFGVLAQVISWIIGPSAGMIYAAKDKLLPAYFLKTNKNNVPYHFIILQGLLVSFWTALLTFNVSENNLSYVIAINLAVLIYMVMYALLFITYLALKKLYPSNPRGFNVPGGAFGQKIIPLIGLSSVFFTIFVSFFIPDQVKAKNTSSQYEIILITSFVIILILPNIIFHFKKKYPQDT